MDNKKKSITILIIGIVVLLLVVGGATFAYFIATGGTPKDMDITVTTNTVDKLDFQVGDDINIFASPDNFASGQGNQSGNSYARAILTPNNKTNTATAHYYLYLNITKNELEYTTSSHKAELMLTVTDGDDNIVTIADLPEVKDGDNNIIGYDITEADGLITILNNHEIVAAGTKTENWNVTVTFINLPDNQNDNTGKLFTAKVLIQETPNTQGIPDICKNKYLNECIALQYNGLNDGGNNGLYHHDGTITSTSVGIDEEGTILDSEDGSYRYSGSNDLVKNYVCFGYDDSSHNYAENWCPEDNIYRIIGVFDNKVKLIKETLASSTLLGTDGDYSMDFDGISFYYWNGVNYNQAYTSTGYYHVWSYSKLNTVNLNTNYLNNIDGSTPGSWSNKIDTSTWYVLSGGHSEVGNAIPKNSYNTEFSNDAKTATETYAPVTAKVGLIYMSDFGYAAYPNAWNKKMTSYSTSNISNNNWMVSGDEFWSISRHSTIENFAFYINSNYSSASNVNSEGEVRPTFYLLSTIQYDGGTGTPSDPYRIK